MDLELTWEQQQLKNAVREFAQREIAPLVDEAEEKEEYPVQLFPKMGSMGYLCVRYPQKYGALEVGKVGECGVIEEIGKVCAGIAAGVMVQGGIGTAMVLENGNEEQKQRYIVPAIKGTRIGAFGLTEPNAGSDAAAIEGTAVRKGDKYVINATKMFITNGNIADFVCVAAYTDKSKGARGGVSVIMVDKGTPGFKVSRKLNKVGYHSAATAELVFSDCEVPASNLVGEEGKGFPYLMDTLKSGRISHAARSLGMTEAAYEASLKYANERVQFGKPIGKNQAVAFKIANMAAEIEAARWLIYRAAYLYDKGEPCLKEACMAKYFMGELSKRVCADALQIHGGYGYVMESPVQRYYRDAALNTITEGTSEIQLRVVARELGL